VHHIQKSNPLSIHQGISSLCLILRSSDHAFWLCVSTRTSSSLSCNDLLLILNNGAASAEAGKQRVGDSIAADGVLGADFLALEELEAVGEWVSGRWMSWWGEDAHQGAPTTA
jgi:hypothetical protein